MQEFHGKLKLAHLSIVATGSGAKGGPTNNDNPSGSLTAKNTHTHKIFKNV
jgi:hypothetical protein